METFGPSPHKVGRPRENGGEIGGMTRVRTADCHVALLIAMTEEKVKGRPARSKTNDGDLRSNPSQGLETL